MSTHEGAPVFHHPFTPVVCIQNQNMFTVVASVGGIVHKMALGGNPHFFVLINGMSLCEWV